MASPIVQSFGSFGAYKTTANAGTAWAAFVPPMPGLGTGVGTTGLSVPAGKAPFAPLRGVIHVTQLVINNGGHGNAVTFLRPKNRVKVTANAAASATSLSLSGDPGVYSTNFNYPLANGQTAPRTGDDAITTNDYVMYQAADGTWVLDTAGSAYTAGAITVSALPTGGVLAGSTLYYFGVTGDTDPSTGGVDPVLPLAASAAINTFSDPNALVSALHPGDPLILYSPNATTADVLMLCAGYYADR